MADNIPQEILDKIDVAYKEFTDNNYPLSEITNATTEDELNIAANARMHLQIGFKKGADYGYHLRDEEVNELKNSLQIAKNCWSEEMTDRMNKESTINELKAALEEIASTGKDWDWGDDFWAVKIAKQLLLKYK